MCAMISKLWFHANTHYSLFWYAILCMNTYTQLENYRSYVDILHIKQLLYYQRCLFSGLDLHAKHDWWVMVPNTYHRLFPCNKPFVHTSTHNWKTTGCKWMFCISNNNSTIDDIPCVLQSCTKHLTGEFWIQTSIVVVLWYNIIMYILLSSYIWISIWCPTTHDNKTHTAYDCTTH